VSPAKSSYTSTNGEREEWEAGFDSVFLGDELINGNGVLVGIGVNGSSGKKDVGDTVSCHASASRVGKSGKEGDIFAMWLQGFSGFVELKVFAFTFGEPMPVGMFRVVFRRKGHAVGKEETGQAFGCRGAGLCWAVGAHGFEKWKAKGDTANSAEDLSTGKVPGFFRAHGGKWGVGSGEWGVGSIFIW